MEQQEAELSRQQREMDLLQRLEEQEEAAEAAVAALRQRLETEHGTAIEALRAELQREHAEAIRELIQQHRDDMLRAASNADISKCTFSLYCQLIHNIPQTSGHLWAFKHKNCTCPGQESKIVSINIVILCAGENESISELTRQLHSEVSRNVQVDERLWGYLRDRQKAASTSSLPEGASASTSAVPAEIQVHAQAANGSVIHSCMHNTFLT
jgi:hypothetical protein